MNSGTLRVEKESASADIRPDSKTAKGGFRVVVWIVAILTLLMVAGIIALVYFGVMNSPLNKRGNVTPPSGSVTAPPSAPVVPADPSPIYGSLMINDNPSTIKQIPVPPGWKIRFGVIGNYKYRWFVDGVPEQQFAPGMNAIVRLPGHAFKGGWQLDPGQGGSAQIVFVMFTGDESRLPAKWHEYSMRYPMN